MLLTLLKPPLHINVLCSNDSITKNQIAHTTKLVQRYPMSKTILDPDVADEAPTVGIITPYDEAHFVTYVRLLDAEAEGADWREVSRIVLHRNPDADSDRTHRCWETHLKRAQWVVEHTASHLTRSKKH
jgi:hypothetical protein